MIVLRLAYSTQSTIVPLFFFFFGIIVSGQITGLRTGRSESGGCSFLGCLIWQLLGNVGHSVFEVGLYRRHAPPAEDICPSGIPSVHERKKKY